MPTPLHNAVVHRTATPHTNNIYLQYGEQKEHGSQGEKQRPQLVVGPPSGVDLEEVQVVDDVVSDVRRRRTGHVDQHAVSNNGAFPIKILLVLQRLSPVPPNPVFTIPHSPWTPSQSLLLLQFAERKEGARHSDASDDRADRKKSNGHVEARINNDLALPRPLDCDLFQAVKPL